MATNFYFNSHGRLECVSDCKLQRTLLERFIVWFIMQLWNHSKFRGWQLWMPYRELIRLHCDHCYVKYCKDILPKER